MNSYYKASLSSTNMNTSSFISIAVVGARRKRKEIMKKLTELQDRRTKLAQVAFQLEEAMKIAKSK